MAAGTLPRKARWYVSVCAELAKRERAVEAWLRGPVGQAHDAAKNGAAELMTIGEVRTSLGGEVSDAHLASMSRR